jgi:hypothetical protein
LPPSPSNGNLSPSAANSEDQGHPADHPPAS